MAQNELEQKIATQAELLGYGAGFTAPAVYWAANLYYWLIVVNLQWTGEGLFALAVVIAFIGVSLGIGVANITYALWYAYLTLKVSGKDW